MRSDSELVRKINSGGPGAEAAWSELCDKYQKLVYHIVSESFPSLRDEAEDIAQEVFIRISRAVDGLELEPERDLKPLLRTILRNLCIDALRRGGPPVAGDDALAWTTDAGASPDARQCKAEVFEYLRRSFHLLPESCQAVICKRMMDDTPYEELAALWNKPPGALRTKMNDCRKAWVEIYKELGGPDIGDD